MHDTIGCSIAVHRGLGPGLAERIYSRALCLELSAAGISFEREKHFEIVYRERVIEVVRVDLVVGGEIVVEVKSIEQIVAVHHKQILNYMRVARLRAGLLLNFNVAILPDGLSRKVL